MDFIFEQIRTGGDRNLAYLIGDRTAKVAAVVDPSFSPEAVLARAEQQGLAVELCLNTHGHDDHTNGNAAVKRLTGAKVAAHPDAPVTPDQPLVDGDTVRVGQFEIRVLHVPGHCPDHLLFHLPAQKVAVTGDHLFVGKIGGTAGEAAARTEYESIQRTLAELPDDTTIWPGHDYGCRPSSTIGLEKIMNPFLLRLRNIDEFMELKRDWAEFKAANGLM